jgi:hypothetical protein
MSESHFLRRYNQIALAIVLTWVLILLGVGSFFSWRSTQEFPDDARWGTANKPSVSGEEFETSNGTITAYKSGSPDDFEALRDVRYVAMATGKVTAISNDAKALIYGERAVGELGRVALLKTGTRNDRPIFDFVFISFPDLDRHVIARSIDSLDTVQQLDDSKFSAIVWGNYDEARFVIVDTKTGSIQDSRNLDFSRPRNTSAFIDGAAAGEAAPETAAPLNKF